MSCGKMMCMTKGCGSRSERMLHRIAQLQVEEFCPEEEFEDDPDALPHAYHRNAAWHCPNCGWNAQMVMRPGGKIGGRWYLCRRCGWRNHSLMPTLGGTARLYLLPANQGRVVAADDDHYQTIPILQRGCGTKEERALRRWELLTTQKGREASAAAALEALQQVAKRPVAKKKRRRQRRRAMPTPS